MSADGDKRSLYEKAFYEPKVRAARSELYGALEAMCPGTKNTVTNYVDVLTIVALQRWCDPNDDGDELQVRPDARTSTAFRQALQALERAYGAYMDALAPYQPSPDMVNDGPLAPWIAPPPAPGSVFYFLPGSGGYWVAGKEGMEAAVWAPLRAQLTTPSLCLCDTPLCAWVWIMLGIVALVLMAWCSSSHIHLWRA